MIIMKMELGLKGSKGTGHNISAQWNGQGRGKVHIKQCQLSQSDVHELQLCENSADNDHGWPA